MNSTPSGNSGNNAAGGFEPPRGRTMNPPSHNEERKGAGREDSEEVSLEREKSKTTGMSNYVVSDGEFTSFPEIMATSAQ